MSEFVMTCRRDVFFENVERNSVVAWRAGKLSSSMRPGDSVQFNGNGSRSRSGENSRAVASNERAGDYVKAAAYAVQRSLARMSESIVVSAHLSESASAKLNVIGGRMGEIASGVIAIK
jgi:hypothetical protein